MYDPQSRLLVVHGMNDERQAEARRAHLLRGDRDEASTYAAQGPVAVQRSVIGRIAAVLHRPTRPALTISHAVR
jgi:hypothetical protein